jgi:hydroxymethylglutaryl-CoA synthase
MTTHGILAYSTYLPRYRLQPERPGRGGKNDRVVASFDQDSTTMAVEAASALLRDRADGDLAYGDGADGDRAGGACEALYLATTSPAYLDKTNATAVHAALGLPAGMFAADLAGSARSATAAWRAAAATGGLVVCADVRTGRPGSADERSGGDGAAAFLFGDRGGAIAEIVAQRSVTTEILDRWRLPGAAAGVQWEERFGLDTYLPLIRETAAAALAEAGIGQADHVVLVSTNSAVVKRGLASVPGARSTIRSPIGHSGACDAGLGLAAALDGADPGETILVLSATDGCDATVLRTTDLLPRSRQARTVAAQLADGLDVPYTTYLSWRGLLDPEPPRRPEPERPAGPPSGRAASWKFSFTGTACAKCGFVHLPPARVCKKCSTVDAMEPRRLAGARGTVATSTVDRLAYSPSPPMVEAVVDFDGGGRYTLEVADAEPDEVRVGTRVGLTFRRLYTAGGIHNYFWKAYVLDQGTSTAAEGQA